MGRWAMRLSCPGAEKMDVITTPEPRMRRPGLGSVHGDTRDRLEKFEWSGAEGPVLLRGLGGVGRGDGRAFYHWL